MVSRRPTAGNLRPVDQPDVRPAVTVLAGFRPATIAPVARDLLAADPDLLLVRHDLTPVRSGVVHRLIRDRRRLLEDEEIPLQHGCVFCTLREDVLPTLARLAATQPHRDLLLVLPETIEPDMITNAAQYCTIDGRPVTDLIRIDSVVTVVDPTTLLTDAESTDLLAERDMQAADDDRRLVAEVVIRQLETADTLLLTGEADPYQTVRAATLLSRLAPWTRVMGTGTGEGAADRAPLHRRLRDAHLFFADTPATLTRGLEGLPIGLDAPEPDCGVVSTVFRTRRPFHPQRLRDALEHLIRGVLRSRGHLWLATQPDHAIAWESAGGGLSMGDLGLWLAALPDHRWPESSPQRQVAASLAWDPRYGDRGTELAFIGLGLDTADLHARLAGCLLTDAEFAAGDTAWRRLPDPLQSCFTTASDTPAGA